MTNKDARFPVFTPYDGPAGGWGALKATAIAVRTQMDAFEAPATLLRTNQPDGFDCPGCAWPDKEHKSTFQFCENGAKASDLGGDHQTGDARIPRGKYPYLPCWQKAILNWRATAA